MPHPTCYVPQYSLSKPAFFRDLIYKRLKEALELMEGVPPGNAGSIFTSSGGAAREFVYRAPIGNIGINIGVAAPMAFFHFGGRRESFFGDLHGQGRDAIEFFTEKKVVISRWW